MNDVRDYLEWHRTYDDPNSTMNWRLHQVRRMVHSFLDDHPGPVRIVSGCAGDGRDIFHVLHSRSDQSRFTTTLVELHPALADAARSNAKGLNGSVDVRCADAGDTTSYVDAAPADLLLMVGVFGNLTAADLDRTVQALPQLCAPRGTVIWSQGRRLPHRGPSRGDQHNESLRASLLVAGFAEDEYTELDRGGLPALGRAHLVGPAAVLQPGQRLFDFVQ